MSHHLLAGSSIHLSLFQTLMFWYCLGFLCIGHTTWVSITKTTSQTELNDNVWTRGLRNNVWCWPKSSFGFFHDMENLNEIFVQRSKNCGGWGREKWLNYPVSYSQSRTLFFRAQFKPLSHSGKVFSDLVNFLWHLALLTLIILRTCILIEHSVYIALFCCC